MQRYAYELRSDGDYIVHLCFSAAVGWYAVTAWLIPNTQIED